MLSGSGGTFADLDADRNEGRKPLLLKGSDVPPVCWRPAFFRSSRFLERIIAACFRTLVAEKTRARTRRQGVSSLKWFQ